MSWRGSRRGLRRAAAAGWWLAAAAGWWLAAGAGSLEAAQPRVRVVHLSGSARQLGRQHGQLLREEVRALSRRVLGHFRAYLKVPLVRSWLTNWWLDSAWRQAARFIPAPYVEELEGLAEGSGVPLRELMRVHAIPDRTYSCASSVAWGRMTKAGRLIHLRNLDWTISAGIQDDPVVFVVSPEGARRFVSVGWAGFIGVLTGINDARISIGQIGAETVDATLRGEPMAFLMRRVLESSGNLEEAAAAIRSARRTVGVNYVLGDAKVPRGIVLESTWHHVRQFEANDPAEHGVAYARPLIDAVARADTAIDPQIRDRQLASKGDPRRPGLEPPGGSAYEVRYLKQIEGLTARAGRLDAEGATGIAKAIAPDSNVQSVIFAWPELWVANADGRIPAARTAYTRLDLTDLLD